MSSAILLLLFVLDGACGVIYDLFVGLGWLFVYFLNAHYGISGICGFMGCLGIAYL
jgi:hypothetical protein